MFNEEFNKCLEKQKKLAKELYGFSCQHHTFNPMGGGQSFSPAWCDGDCGSNFTSHGKPFSCQQCQPQKYQEVEDVWQEANKLEIDWVNEHAFCQKGKDKEESFAKAVNEFLKDNNFKKISLENGKMTIKFTNSSRNDQVIDENNPPYRELRVIAYQMKKKGLKQIEYPLTKQSVQNGGSGNPNNYLPYLFGFLAVVILIIGLIYYFYRKLSNKKQSKREIQ